MSMKFKLFDHQEVALAHMQINDYFALFMEQGTGKTLPTLVHLNDLLKDGLIKDALIVGPISALGAWERDMEMFDAESQKRLQDNITIINYESVWRVKQGVCKYDKEWGAIVLDEAQAIKGRTNKQSKFLLELSLKAKYKYILTGTPVSNGKLENIWALYTFLNPRKGPRSVYSEIFDGSYYDFLEKYCITNRWRVPTRYVNVEELQDIINEYSYRVLKEDCLDLPEKLPDEIIKVPMGAKQKRAYKEMRNESTLIDYELVAENALARKTMERQLASGYIKVDGELIEYDHNKLKTLMELLDANDKKVVIFAQYSYSIQSIEKMMTVNGINSVTLDGRQKDKNIWRKFQSDEDIRVIIVQYQSGSAGIDLFASDTIIYYEPTDRSELLEQSRDRIHRTGQKSKCSYYHLLTTGTVEVAMYRTLANFEDFNERLYTEYISTYERGWS